ncbi:MAG TPA: DUF2244 domain-containing protein [Methylotenera sp.]|nr:DUF2244 domain-containing protein [Methylotenera sp.]HPV32726.1 DUF2244 domain-containing protein [Methylotenera sp.]
MAVTDFGYKLIAKPNNSMSPRDTLMLVMGLATLSFVIAIAFARIGAWLVLPFAGLEILAISYAFYYIHLHSDDFDSITIKQDEVVVEKRNDKQLTTTVFQRHWAQVSVRDVASGGGAIGKRGLFIRSHGQEVEFGRNFINDEQRDVLALELKKKLKNIHS